jgi:ribonuclease Z
MKVVFLGTSAMVPTKERNHPSTLILYKNEGILLDCGEGTQRQLKFAKIKPTKITKILISHWHGDHVFGLPGLIQTLGADEYDGILRIYGPKGTKKMLDNVLNAFILTSKVEIEVHEVEFGKFFENDHYQLKAFPLRHTAKTIGFRFEEKEVRKMSASLIKKFNVPHGPLVGKLQDGQNIKVDGKVIKPDDVSTIKKGRIIGFISDTGMDNHSLKIAKDADLLISEATFTDEHEEKARLFKHLTAKQAALIASNSKVKKLVLTHFSQRYRTTDKSLEEAQSIFPKVICAKDFLSLSL